MSAKRRVTSPSELTWAPLRSADTNDKNREVSPAVAAEDAIYLDNSGFTAEQTAKAALKIINDKLNRSVL